MIRGALILLLAALLQLTQQAVFTDCACGPVDTFTQSTAAYCPTSSYPSCDSTKLVESSCTITCQNPRATVAYRNNSATFITTSSITCTGGTFYNAAGLKITVLSRPTCAYLSPCDGCSLDFETTCPSGMSCNQDNFQVSIAADGCKRATCLNSATLKIYDNTKTALAYSANQLYCMTNSKWSNYSLNGGITGGNTITASPVTANCVLPSTCETCSNPTFVTNASQMPAAFQTGYNQATPAVTKVSGQCTTVTCPSGFLLYGFSGNSTTQNGLNYTNQNFLRCAAIGQWTNGGMAYTPSDLKVTCLQKQIVCPYPDIVAGTTFTQTCDTTSKINSITCAAGKNLTMRYSTESSTVRFERATFFAGKGWLAHACGGIAALFTTATGNAITAVCA